MASSRYATTQEITQLTDIRELRAKGEAFGLRIHNIEVDTKHSRSMKYGPIEAIEETRLAMLRKHSLISSRAIRDRSAS